MFKENPVGFVVVVVIIGFGIGMLIVIWRVLDNAWFFLGGVGDDDGLFLGSEWLVRIRGIRVNLFDRLFWITSVLNCRIDMRCLALASLFL